jgi:hypothetical protein
VIEKDLKKILNKENIIESSDQEVEKVENGEESGNGSEE